MVSIDLIVYLFSLYIDVPFGDCHIFTASQVLTRVLM